MSPRSEVVLHWVCLHKNFASSLLQILTEVAVLMSFSNIITALIISKGFALGIQSILE